MVGSCKEAAARCSGGHAARQGPAAGAPTLECPFAGQGRHQAAPAQHQALQVVRVEQGWCLWAHAGRPPARALLVLISKEGRLHAAILAALLLQGTWQGLGIVDMLMVCMAAMAVQRRPAGRRTAAAGSGGGGKRWQGQDGVTHHGWALLSLSVLGSVAAARAPGCNLGGGVRGAWSSSREARQRTAHPRWRLAADLCRTTEVLGGRRWV